MDRIPALEALLSQMSDEGLALVTEWQHAIVRAVEALQVSTNKEMQHLGHSRRNIQLVSQAIRGVIAALRVYEERMNAHGEERAARTELNAEAADGRVAGELHSPIATCYRTAYGETEILFRGRWYLLDSSRSRGE